MKTYWPCKIGMWFFGASLMAASCTGEGGGIFGNHGQGGIDMGVEVSGLLDGQFFCFTWSLFQQDGDKWDLIDRNDTPQCSQDGADALSDFATCYDGRRFLVEYNVSFYDANGQIADATATSGGGPNDVCVRSTDTPTNAILQLNNEGNAGGVNPSVDVELVCSNNKLELEGDTLVSALWLQSDDCSSCAAGSPDLRCMLGYGAGISTKREGMTVDGMTRFIFNTADQSEAWEIDYLAFDVGLDLSKLHLTNSPWVLHHFSTGSTFGNEQLEDAIGSFRFGESVGYIRVVDDKVQVNYSLAGACGDSLSLTAKTQEMALPACSSGSAEAIGVVAKSGSAFDIIFKCSDNILSIGCDAKGINGVICAE